MTNLKKIKKLLAALIIGSVVTVGVTQLSTVQASACSPDSHPYVNFKMGNFPRVVFSTAMKYQYSDYVYKIQFMLNHIGYNAGTPDGYYGSNTYNAVYNFQADHDLTRDAKVGEATWNELKTHCIPF